MCKHITDWEVVCTKTLWLWEMPPRRERGGRVRGVLPKVRALQRQVQALQEEIYRGMNLVVKDESEEENEEGNVVQEGEEE